MDKPIKTLALLIVEDVESDALLIVRLLSKAGYELVYEQVETAEQMRAALKKRPWDIVISDYSLPQFDGHSALKLLKESGQDIPFIVVSGAMGEETAVAMMKAGTHDYLMKDNLARLIPAVERELEQAQVRRERRQAEQSRAASESELRALFASMHDLVMVIDRQGGCRKIAPTNQSLLVKPASELVGNNLRDFFPVETTALFIAAIQQVLDTGQTVRIEYEAPLDARIIWLETSISPMDTDTVLCVVRDVTERKRAEEQLREGEEKYRTLFDSLPDAVTIIGFDGRIMMCNEASAKLARSSKEKLIGRHFTTLGMLDPKEMPKYLRIFSQLISGSGECLLEVETNQGGDHQKLEVVVNLLSMGGKFNAIQVIAHDITGRIQAEKALVASETKLRALVEQVPAIVYTESADTRETTYISPQLEKMTGYTPVEWVNDHKFWEKVIHPEDRAYVIEKDTLTTKTYEPFSTEYRLLTRDGRVLWIHDEAVLIRSQDGAPLFWQGVMYDITERKQAEVLLQQSQANLLSALRVAHMGHWEFDISTQIFTFNDQYYSLHGMTAQEAGGYQMSAQTFAQQYVHPEDASTVGYAIQQAIEATNPNFQYQVEARILRADGESRWVTVWFRIEKDAQGQTVKMFGVNQDVTERKQAEEYLHKSEERYRELFNSMIDGFALHEIICDAAGKPVDYRFLEINPAFERLTGLRSETLIGRTVLEAMPDTEPYWIEFYGNVALTGRSAFFENYAKELGHHFEVSAYCPRPGQFAVIMVDATERKRVEDDIHQRMTELEMLHQSGLALSQLLNPVEIGRKILELLEEKLNWRHTRIRLYHPQGDLLELLDFNKPGLNGEEEHRKTVEYFQPLITHAGQGLSGWVIQHGQVVRSGNVNHDPRYIEAYPGIRSGLYVPMKLSERIIGVISIESEQPNAFSETDERLISTLAAQAASAFENARLFEETRQRVMELETLNRISLVLRAVTKQNEMLSIVLDEALAILNTSHGSIELYNKTTDTLDQVILRGWLADLTEPHPASDGIAGRVLTTGEIYISREFASDPETRPVAQGQIPSRWGGVCLPIRTTQQILGVMIVSMPSEHVLSRDEIRLLSILSEMTGAALQRMQLHEQTVRRLEHLKALRAVDQAISSSRDMRLTLQILLTHTTSQLNVDAADVLLLHSGSTMLELVAGRGFHTFHLENVSLRESFAGRVILEHLPIMELTYETAMQNPKFGKNWQDEGFVCYWCVPLVIKGEVKGALEIYCRKAFTPDAEWFEFLEALAGQAAIAIDNTQLFENLQRANMDLSLAYDATIEGWSRALDLRDHETEGHTLRVTDLTLTLARAMQVGEAQLTAIRRGALLHDIGKMGVPDSILLKEGNLTGEEWVLMRKHPQFAHDMLLPITYLRDALDIPYCHHEKWDGTGYPQGLQGNQIPLAARIFAIVDVWDALTNDRTYRKKWTYQQTREYIVEQSGKHFDPKIVEVFLQNIAEE